MTCGKKGGGGGVEGGGGLALLCLAVCPWELWGRVGVFLSRLKLAITSVEKRAIFLFFIFLYIFFLTLLNSAHSLVGVLFALTLSAFSLPYCSSVRIYT